MFLAQIATAGVLAVIVLAFAGSPANGPSVLGAVLAGLGLVQFALGITLPDVVARPADKGSVLSATLLAAVLLATPAWFLMLGLITGQPTVPLLALGLLVLLGYAVGFGLSGRFGRRVAAFSEQRAAERAAGGAVDWRPADTDERAAR